MKHAIGGKYAEKPYRNYYNTGRFEDESWNELVDLGLATQRICDKKSGGVYYHLTDIGIKTIMEIIKEYKMNTTWKKKKDRDFADKAEKLGYKVRGYSGRGMFGQICPGVTVKNTNDFIAEMGMKGLKIDSMGLSYIVYTG